MPLATRQGASPAPPGPFVFYYFKKLARPRLSLVAIIIYALVFLGIAFTVVYKMRFQSYVSAARCLRFQLCLSSKPAVVTLLQIPSRSITSPRKHHCFLHWIRRASVALYVPDSNGTIQDVVVGYDDPETYVHDSETNHTFFGSMSVAMPIVSRMARSPLMETHTKSPRTRTVAPTPFTVAPSATTRAIGR